MAGKNSSCFCFGSHNIKRRPLISTSVIGITRYDDLNEPVECAMAHRHAEETMPLWVVTEPVEVGNTYNDIVD